MYSALSGPMDWIRCYIKTTFTFFYTKCVMVHDLKLNYFFKMLCHFLYINADMSTQLRGLHIQAVYTSEFF